MHYQRITLVVPFDPSREERPEEWDWQNVADLVESASVESAEDPFELVEEDIL